MKLVSIYIRIKNRIKVIPYYDIPRLPTIFRGVFHNNLIKGYWCDFANFGDQITPLLLEYYKFTPLLSPAKHARFVSTGSILEHIPKSFSGSILGAGFIYESSRETFPKAKIIGVRGQLTKDHLGLSRNKDVILGDPGLLASKFLQWRENKQYNLGIIPHYIDKNNINIQRIYNLWPQKVNIINVEQKDPLIVFKEIDKCKYIVSSSLHGLIVADSLGIPNAWFYSPGLEGNRFKFEDYYSSLNITVPKRYEISETNTLDELISMTTLKPQETIEELKKSLDNAFLSMRRRKYVLSRLRL